MSQALRSRGGGRWTGSQASTDMRRYEEATVLGVAYMLRVNQRLHRERTKEVRGSCETHKNKWASFGVTFFYLLEQIYSASFSAFPQCCPSVSRPILFTGKQQNIFLYMAF